MEKSIIIVVVLAALAGIAVWFMMPMMPKGGGAVSSNDMATSAPAPVPANTPMKDTSSTPPKDTSAPKVVAMTISMGEFSFTVDGQAANGTITLDAGKTYAITFVDNGAVGHEAKIGKGDMIKRDDGTPDGYTDNFYADVSAVLTKGSAASETSGESDSAASSSTLEEVELDSGESATITFTVPDSLAGQTFEIGCFVPGHYEAGMKATVVIK